MPSSPSIGARKAAEDLLGIEFEFWRGDGRVAVDDEVICFRFRADRIPEPIWIEGAADLKGRSFVKLTEPVDKETA